MSAVLRELVAGCGVVLDGVEYTVERLEPQYGRVWLVRGDGQRMGVSIRSLIGHSSCQPSPGAAAAGGGRQPMMVRDLSVHQRDLVLLRQAHLLEAETGFRSGDRLRPGPGEPKPEYDPAATTLAQRRRAKAAELRAVDREQARLLGLDRVSSRTLARWGARHRRLGVMGCADGRWLRAGGGHPSVGEEVREAIFAVRQETLHRSKMSMKAREVLLRQFVLERSGPEVRVPGSETLRLVWREWFGPGGTRQRYARSVPPEGGGQHVVVHRPGQVVALDTTILPVKVRDGVFGDPVSVHLTLALDACTHSLVAFRLTMVSDLAVDVAMLLRDIMMPLPLREDWGQELEWPYPGIPAAVVAEFAGHKVAGLPFFAPETITTDHGSVYKNHHLVEVQRVIGANILPARVLRPTDKHAAERAFGGIRSLLFEYLPGYTGIDAADRGADPEADAVLSIEEMEHLIATWIVAIWQNRRLGEYAPAWDPAGGHSPNTLFAAAMAQGGFALQIPGPELFYDLLPAHYVQIHGRRGVKIRGLWYDGPALDSYRDDRSARSGQHKGRWVIRRDPRDRRFAFFQDPLTHQWHALRWTGLPPDGEVPSFGDARVTELLTAARQAGLAPRSDAELLPLLLRLIGGHVPVSGWPAQLTRNQRTGHAREVTQARAAAADRPAPGGPDRDDESAVAPARWHQRAGQASDAVDADRRRRREQATAGRAAAVPPRLGDAIRRKHLFMLPADGDDAGGEHASASPGEETRR